LIGRRQSPKRSFPTLERLNAMPNSEDGRKRIDALNEWKDRGESDEVWKAKGLLDAGRLAEEG
jgi:hypothetical protein